MIISNSTNRQQKPINFKGPLDGIVTNTLRTLDTNPMANAVGIDLFAMVGPRTYIDTKERNKYAGAETFFREFTGTFIVCLSASFMAKGIAKLANKLYKPNVKINPKSWFSKDSLNFLNNAWNKTKNTTKYTEHILNQISGQDGNKTNKFKDINWENIEWVDEKRWNKYKWDNPKYKNIHTKLKDKSSIVSTITELIDNKQISNKDRKQLFNITELRLTNALKADKVQAGALSSSMHNLLRDTIDLGKDVFTNNKIKPNEAINKILKINKVKSIGALILASTLGLTNQYINRKITEKRTGKKGFVGDTNYSNNEKTIKTPKKNKKLFAEKLLASVGMLAMTIGVMKVKSPKDFVKKLEFTGPVTSGNAIKTVYASTLIGRFMASDSKDELRETVTRDYLGFLNWLVIGGFAAKLTANLLDRKRTALFNISKQGKGIKHWFNDLSLKSHNEIASKGSKFAKQNMWKLNLSHIAGLGYSTLALGILLPKLNIFITNRKNKNKTKPVKLAEIKRPFDKQQKEWQTLKQ